MYCLFRSRNQSSGSSENPGPGIDSVEGDGEDASHDDVRAHLDEHIFVRLRLGRVRGSEERGKLGSIGRWPFIRKMA